ncbi:hypothetical protein [Corynebacterium pyruviciproducens]|uniref:Uncharacterized protein n=1 Tax=Corynebacterium pyruviciproducens TaxID=598660 RepID=A0AAF0YY56_9CORY|nr:hypothetical protein [Corynebacterium pyruviciproducens]WOT03383.1 hypothetical protein CYJ47_06415 [Corynebacterium pyruviciproducens]
MNDGSLVEWITASPAQFIVGVFVLVFGTRKVLSEENIRSSLGGVRLLQEWASKSAKRRAEKELSREAALDEDNRRLYRERLVTHEWKVYVEGYVNDIELWFASRGISYPFEKFKHFTEWRDSFEE